MAGMLAIHARCTSQKETTPAAASLPSAIASAISTRRRSRARLVTRRRAYRQVLKYRQVKPRPAIGLAGFGIFHILRLRKISQSPGESVFHGPAVMNVHALTEYENTQLSDRQPLPDAYRRLADGEMSLRLAAAKAALGERLVVLGHHYQRDEVIAFADHTGDSLKL